MVDSSEYNIMVETATRVSCSKKKKCSLVEKGMSLPQAAAVVQKRSKRSPIDIPRRGAIKFDLGGALT